MTKKHAATLILSLFAQFLSAAPIWHHPDSLVAMQTEDSIYSYRAGILHSRYQRDFSRWCVYAYHYGIRMDSTKQHNLY